MESPPAGSLLERALHDAAGNSDDATDDATDNAGAETSTASQTRILDAAYELFCHYGIQRTTMEDVARQAGLSRITVYRRMESKEALIEQVVLREFRRYFDRFLEDVAAARTVADRVVAGFVGSLRAIRGNPLIGRLMASEPDVFAPSIIGEQGHTMAVVSAFVARQLRREQRAGHVAEDVDVDLVAELMVRVSGSFLLTPSPRIDLDDDQQLGEIARRFLVPMLSAFPAPPGAGRG